MKKLIRLLLVATFAISLTACGGNNKNETAEEKSETTEVSKEESIDEDKSEAKDDNKETVKLNVAYMPNYASLWHLVTAVDKGFFEEEGLDVNLIEFADGPSEIAAMEGGSVDLAYIGHGAHKLAIQGKADIIAPSSVHNTDKITVLPDKGIEKIEDIKGKKIAYNAKSSSETALQGALAKAGITMDDIEPYEMDATNMVAAMMSGAVDACTAWNPYDSQILENVEGSKQIEFSTDSVNMSSFIALPKYVEENRDIVLRFSRAIYKAMEFASQKENWDYAVELYAKQAGKDKEKSMIETSDAKWFSATDIKSGLEDGTIKDYYERQQKMFTDSEEAIEERPVEEYVRFDLMEEALK
ncbi:MAG: ABC transporter substrate-binding protein [Anaerococcus sp.]|uniref:ABC transporter substrate-binding protein n=1 Tax=Anaerococcus sp. TaxID=1872515 RepID=UPI002619261B|nr:ABC transporter substrate-binding protein [Anaerococcus sp.]MCI5971508.1 ABC transporter substrate-binding protein [Anaerococcus sp.]MDD6919099.1 ABC transporter substrate-binding protein [Peptoniphilaceae bacterium]MDY2927443.1 ABC transporter substrate-binding protein [Anaerococcus sp.]